MIKKTTSRVMVMIMVLFNLVYSASTHSIDNYGFTEKEKAYIKLQYKIMTEKQKEIITKTFHQGNLLKIKNEHYGQTIATYAFAESSAGVKIVGDDGVSFGLSHFTLLRLREILIHHPVYNYLNNETDEFLIKALKQVPEFSVEMTMLNFKLNLKRWKDYKAAVVSHNGYNPYKGFHNEAYWRYFLKCREVVRLVLREQKLA
jgi:hypothetical protein